jgi:cell division protein FtsW
VSGRKPAYAGGAVARYLMFGSAIALMVVGLVMVFSASYVSDMVDTGSMFYHGLRQAIYIALGLGVALVLARFDYRRLKESSRLVWWASIVLLVVTFAVGVVGGGARRWIDLGVVTLQPSEIAKVATVLFVAALAVQWQRGRVDTGKFAVSVAGAALLPSVLIIVQPDLGTAMSLMLAVIVVLWLADAPVSWFVAAGAVVLVAGVVGIAAEPYRLARVTTFLHPGKDPLRGGYQIIQALLAFGSGGIKGVGLGLSRQKFFYLPQANTDFIFAIIGEELGLIGTLAVLSGFGIFIYGGMRIALGARDQFGRMVAGGLTAMIGLQAFMNMAAVTGLMPVTGKPLPFVSAGGSSMLVTMTCVGLLLSVSRFGAKTPRVVRRKMRDEEGPREGPAERRGDRGPHLSRFDGGRAVRRRA